MLRLFGFGVLLTLISACLALATNFLCFRILTALLGVAVIGTYLFLHRSSPRRTGTLHLPGLRDKVEVYMDDRGVPHIYAGNLHDLYMAQGYMTAQDRLWAMDMHRRAASGRLSEVIGETALDVDRHFRTLGLHRAAAASLPLYGPEAREALEAYAAGVNERMAGGHLPPEYAILGCRPDPWTPEDSLLLGKYVAYNLTGNWDRELFRATLVQAVGAEKAGELFWLPPDAELLRVLEATPLPDVDHLQAIAAATLNEASGANGWVVGGGKTRSGTPILANDPHLAAESPAVWYQSHLVGPGGLDVTGAAIPGIPGILLGHNREIAWGATSLNADCQDLYIEQAHPAAPDQFRFQDNWEQAEHIEETIRVRGAAAPVIHKVLVSRHGPIVAHGGSTALALRWTALEPSTELEAFLAINRARSWGEFRQALQLFGAPALQFVFAGRDGTFAGRSAGKIPRRTRGYGQAPMPGWTGEYEWDGQIPFADLPETVNPETGFVAAASPGQSCSRELGSGCMPLFRTQRVAERLSGATDLTIEKVEAIQTDNVNLHARSLLQILLNAIQEGLRQGPHPEALNETEKRAMLLLSGWDCCETKAAAAPLLWHQWYLFLLEGIFRPQLGLAMFDRFVASGMPMQVADRLIQQVAGGRTSQWLAAEGEESLSRIALRAFRRAVGYLAAKHGTSPERWRWGKEHTITFRHTLTGRLRWLRPFLDIGPHSLDGSTMTLNRPGFSQLNPFQVTVAATWRQIVDMGQPEEGRDICAPGQSGHPLSPHYYDQIGHWLKDEAQPQLMRHKTIRTLPCLVLQPGPDR